MKNVMKPLAIGVMAASVLASGCMGKFALTGKLYGWNKKASTERWANEAIFVGLAVILPVYSLTLLGDGIIFNSVEWWTGKNPILAGTSQKVQGADGSEAVMTMRADGNIDVQATAADGKQTSFTLARTDGDVAVLDDQGQPLGVTTAL